MSVATLDRRPVTQSSVATGLRTALLARLADAKGATAAEVVRDVMILFPAAHQSAARREVRDAIGQLLQEGLAREQLKRLHLTDVGRAAASEALGGKALPKDWPAIRDQRLVALALGLQDQAAARLTALAKPDGLRAAIVQTAFALSPKTLTSPARMRTALSVVALERAFGNKIKGGMGAGDGLSAKAGRMLAAQLSRKPRDFGTDSRLVAALAAEHFDVKSPDADVLRVALLRRYLARSLTEPVQRKAGITALPPVAAISAAPPPVQPTLPLAPPAARLPASTRPDLAGFASAVQQAARKRAEGWPGNRKAFISHAWAALDAAHPEWGIGLIEFKGMLTEAHRTGVIVLASADLKDKDRLKDFQESAIAYKNTVWHFVRVED